MHNITNIPKLDIKEFEAYFSEQNNFKILLKGLAESGLVEEGCIFDKDLEFVDTFIVNTGVLRSLLRDFTDFKKLGEVINTCFDGVFGKEARPLSVEIFRAVA